MAIRVDAGRPTRMVGPPFDFTHGISCLKTWILISYMGSPGSKLVDSLVVSRPFGFSLSPDFEKHPEASGLQSFANSGSGCLRGGPGGVGNPRFESAKGRPKLATLPSINK